MSIFPIAALAGGFSMLVLAGLLVAGRLPRASIVWPLAVLVPFLAWSLFAVASEGPLGFWWEHTDSAWGVQVWFDLLIAVALGLSLLAPRARALGEPVAPWVAATLCLGGIGLLAFAARVIWLEGRRGGAPSPMPA